MYLYFQPPERKKTYKELREEEKARRASLEQPKKDEVRIGPKSQGLLWGFYFKIQFLKAIFEFSIIKLMLIKSPNSLSPLSGKEICIQTQKGILLDVY